ncbi:MAG: hypothetical protein OHK0056_07490 [Bacteriovoracaceae bacterium]
MLSYSFIAALSLSTAFAQTPNRQEWEQMVRDFGQSIMQHVSGEAWETALTGYINKGLYRTSCALGVFDLERSSTETRFAYINMKSRNFLGATRAAHATGGGSSEESAGVSLDKFIEMTPRNGGRFTPLGFHESDSTCNHGGTTLDEFLRRSGRSRADYSSHINEVIEIWGSMGYKIMAGVLLNGKDPLNRNTAAREVMIHEGTQCQRSGPCWQSFGCIVPPLRTQRSLCENVLNKGRTVVYIHKNGFADRYNDYKDWQRAFPTLKQWYSGTTDCLDYGQSAFNNPGAPTNTPPQSLVAGSSRVLNTAEMEARSNLLGRGPEIILGGSPLGTPFSGTDSSDLTPNSTGNNIMLMGVLAVPAAASLINTKQNQVAEGSHEYKMCQSLSNQTLCKSVQSCRQGIVDSGRFGQASQVAANESLKWTAGETEYAAAEMQNHIQDCYAYDCLEQKSEEFVCAGSTVVDSAKLGRTLEKTTYDRRSSCDPGTFQTQDNEACRVALQEYDDFAQAEARLHAELEQQTRVNLTTMAQQYSEDKDKQVNAGDFQRGQLTGFSSTFSQLADFQLAKAAVMTAHYNKFPTFEKMKNDCIKRIVPYQNEGVDTYNYMIKQYDDYIQSMPSTDSITNACDRVISRDSSILIRNNSSREFVARVIDESLVLEKKYRDAANDLSNKSLDVGDLFNKLKDSGVLSDLDARKRELKKCEEDNCFGKMEGRLSENVSYSSDSQFAEAFNYRNRLFQRVRSNEPLKDLASVSPTVLGKFVDSVSFRRKDSNRLEVTVRKEDLNSAEIPGAKYQIPKTGIHDASFIEELPTFYARSRYWRDHYDVLRTPDGTEVIDPISSADSPLFLIISQRYNYHFYELPKLKKVEGKNFFKTIGD